MNIEGREFNENPLMNVFLNKGNLNEQNIGNHCVGAYCC